MLSLPAWVTFASVFVVAFAVAWGLAPAAAWLSRRLGMVALPGGRRRHQGAIPRLGGLAIYGGFMVAVLLTLPYPRYPADSFRLAGLLLGSTVIVAGGVIDDRYQLAGLPQIAIALAAGLIAIRYWVFIERVNSPFADTPLVFPMPIVVVLTLLWYVGMTTTVNWLDGLDGLATGVSAIAALIFFLHMLRTGQESVALLPLALLGATLGFLPHNWHPARVFIGSCGAYFLGFAVGGLALIGGARAATALLVMGAPIVDAGLQILHRIRRGRSPGTGDRGHLHFRLADLGLRQPRIVLGYYALSAALGLLALLLPSRLFKLVALLGLGLIVTTLLAIVSHLGQAREQADIEPP
jgi:UDP-GlcNAc:undecaprenyl-phosphate GlcNAc-1-phosphate transferase